MYGLCGILLITLWNMTNNNLHELPSYGIDNLRIVRVEFPEVEEYDVWRGEDC